MNIYLAIFIGGGLGSMARYGISRFVAETFSKIYPLATFIANMLATLILALVMYFFASKYNLSTSIKAMLATGFCGGFSTFSTFSYETFELLRNGHLLWAFFNIFLSIALGVFIMYLIHNNLKLQ